MPIYEYSCKRCAETFEELVSSDREQIACPGCGSTDTQKLMSCSCFKSSGSDGGYAASSGGSSCGSCAGGNCASCH